MKLQIKESHNTEFKQTWKDEYIKWISAFANGAGGTLYIGVADNGVIVGIESTAKLLEDIPNKIRDILGITVDVNLKSSNNKDYLEIITDKYPYPISYKGSYYYRSGSITQELKGAALDKFLLSRQGKKWDGVPVPYFGDDDLLIAEVVDNTTSRGRTIRFLFEGSNEELKTILDKYGIKDWK